MNQLSEDLINYVETVKAVDRYLYAGYHKTALALAFNEKKANKKPHYNIFYEILIERIMNTPIELIGRDEKVKRLLEVQLK